MPKIEEKQLVVNELKEKIETLITVSKQPKS